MFEHVGAPNYQAYFDTVARLLADDGVAVIHSIGRTMERRTTQPWIAKYIFPGGYIPALSEVLPAIERAGLWVTDIEILRLHYAETLKAWRDRFAARRDEIAALYDERFCRMWEFYLASARWPSAARAHGLPAAAGQAADRRRAGAAVGAAVDSSVTGALVGGAAGAAIGAATTPRYDNFNRRQYYDERARRYYYYDSGSGRYYWENGSPRY
jgi:hypothetical protein